MGRRAHLAVARFFSFLCFPSFLSFSWLFVVYLFVGFFSFHFLMQSLFVSFFFSGLLPSKSAVRSFTSFAVPVRRDPYCRGYDTIRRAAFSPAFFHFLYHPRALRVVPSISHPRRPPSSLFYSITSRAGHLYIRTRADGGAAG
jgi:hypothetical protein